MKNKVILGLTSSVLVGIGLVSSVAFAKSPAITTSLTSNPIEQEVAITGSALEQASKIALAHIGSGRVTSTEVGDEESYYQVEVTKDDGTQVDVQLDKKFDVVGEKADSENSDK